MNNSKVGTTENAKANEMQLFFGSPNRVEKQRLTYQIAYSAGYHHSGANACECYGVVNGCDCDCPVFLDGDCKTVEGNEQPFIEMIDRCQPDKETLEDIYDYYPNLKPKDNE